LPKGGSPLRIILAGGGTAGHINPAIAIANFIRLKDPDAQILFIGTEHGMERELIPREGYDITFIRVSGMKGKRNLKNLVPAAQFVLAIGACRRIIRRFRPDVVVGTGGYVCAPVVAAANSMHIPTLIHEQNVFPGSAIRMLAKRSDVTAISFGESARYLGDAKEILLTGNPIRPAVLQADRARARKELGLSDERYIVAFGGSLGAKRINEVMCDYIASIRHDTSVRLCFATGERGYQEVMNTLHERGLEHLGHVEVKKYIHNMDVALAAADLAICRSGAITVSELMALGVPSILIPSPNVTNNHQEYNARALADNGAAVMIAEKDFDVHSLERETKRLLDHPQILRETAEHAIAMSKTQATEMIYDKLVSMMH